MNNMVVAYNPQDAQNAYQRLQFSLNKDDLKIAIVEIKTFLKIFPDVALACNDLGALYYQTGEKLLALACYEKANRLQPGLPTVIKNLAEFYFVELGWTDDAIMMLTSLLKQFPQDCELLTSLGMISARLGKENEARSFFRQVLDLDPDNSDVREALARLEGPVSSAEYRRQLAPVEPVQPAVVPAQPTQQDAQLGDILARLRASVAVSQPAASATGSTVRNDNDLYAEAQKIAATGNTMGAIEALNKVIDINPSNVLALNDLGVLYAQTGHLDKALFYHEAAVSRDPGNANFRKNLAALYYSCLGRTDEAISIYTQLLRDTPNDIETLTALAIISEANNLKEQARTFIVKVLELEPWNVTARVFLAGL